MDDEFIIKRKLTFDGEGLGDERRLNLLQRMIARWILINNSCEENQAVYNKICSQVSAVEHCQRKSDLIKRNYQNELMRYQHYREELETNICNIKKAIKCSKLLLLEVRNSKQQKLSYNMIAKNISIEPSRSKTSDSVKELQSKLFNLKKSENKLNNEWSIWRKHCSIIVTTANQLNSIIEMSNFD